jgi:ribosomal protein S3
LVLYTDSPGQLIGKSGANVAMLRNLLAEKLIGNWTVEFAEIKGGFVL